MKKILLTLIIALSLTTNCISQEWFTSFDIAKRLALAQNKMLFVVWEDSFVPPYFVEVRDESGKTVYIDLTSDEEVNKIIREYFVPVKLPEAEYGELYLRAKEINGEEYLNKLGDSSIKVMDVNGNILNSISYLDFYDGYENIAFLIKMYSLDTTYLNPFLRSYLKKQNFNTTFMLGSKYFDYAVFSQKDVRPEIIRLASTYLKEARSYLRDSNLENKNAFLQKLDLYEIQELLVLNNPKKARRVLKRIEESEVDKINKPLFVFLNYTTFILLKDEENASIWREKITQSNLKKTSQILKSHN